jgi:Flp pilus assembly protein TadD
LLNQVEVAIQALDKACRHTRGASAFYSGHYGWKGIALMRESRWAEAEVVEDEILAVFPTTNFVLMHKAILYQREGRADEAREFAKRTRAADPDASLAMWELRMSRWHAGSPTLDIILDNLRSAWLASEPGA